MFQICGETGPVRFCQINPELKNIFFSFLIDPFQHINSRGLVWFQQNCHSVLIRRSRSPVSALDVTLICDPPPPGTAASFSSCVVCSELRSAHSRLGWRSRIDAKRSVCRCWGQMDQISQRGDCSTSERLPHRPPHSPQSVLFCFFLVHSFFCCRLFFVSQIICHGNIFDFSAIQPLLSLSLSF